MDGLAEDFKVRAAAPASPPLQRSYTDLGPRALSTFIAAQMHLNAMRIHACMRSTSKRVWPRC